MYPREFFNHQIIVSDPEELYGFSPFPTLDDRKGLLKSLLGGLRSPAAHQRSNCCSALLELYKAEEVEKDVIKVLHDSGIDRVQTIRLAVQLHLPVEGILIELLNDQLEEVRFWSAWGLGWYPTSRSRNALRAVLMSHRQKSFHNESDAELLFVSGIEGLSAQRLFDRAAAMAAESLARIGHNRDIPLLLLLLQEGDPLVRLRIARVLAD